MTLLSWDIPLISFNGSLWDVLLRCSKWLLGAWLDSFTMIPRCWLVVWVKWARPLVSMTLWSRVMFNWKAVSSQWGNFGTLLPPRGASFTPLCGMFLQSPSASSNVANFTFLRNPLSELWVCEFWLLRCSKWLLGAWLDSFTMILRCWLVVWVKWARPLVSMTLWSRVMFNWKAVQLKGRPISWAVLHHRKPMGQILVPSCPPGLQLLPHFEVWSYRARQPLQMWQISSGGPLSALTCCVNARLLSAIKKNIAVNLFSKLGWELGLYYALWWLSPWYFSADVYLAELHCRGRERVFELEARSPWWTDC